MSDARRKAEIEAKRAKLQELRQAREARKNVIVSDKENVQRDGDSERPSSRAQLDDLVSSLLGGQSSPAAPSSIGHTPRETDSPNLYDSRSSQASDPGVLGREQGNNEPGTMLKSSSAVPFPDFTDVQQELFQVTPPKSTLMYNKSIQTASVVPTASDTPDPSTGGVETSTSTASNDAIRRATEDEMRASILAELASESTAAQLESDDQLLRGLTYEELQAVYGSSDFANFLESSSKIIQRAQSDRYDYLRDYSLSTTADDQEGNEAKHVRLLCAFEDARWTKNRSITSVDWSYKFPELSLASYNKNTFAANDPDGIVCLWNLYLRDRPEFIFHSPSDVLSAIFSPFQPNTVIGGTFSGQILIWDNRAKHAPVLKTPLSAAGHTHPVYSLDVIGTQNAHNLVSASTDGMVCTWLMDMPARPQETLELTHPSHAKTEEVSVTCLGAPDNETGSLFVGTEEGPIFTANRFDRAGVKAGLVSSEVYRAHTGPITGLNFHPLHGPVDFGDLFLTSGVDWTVRLWRAKAGVDSQTNIRNPSSAVASNNPIGGVPASAGSATTGNSSSFSGRASTNSKSQASSAASSSMRPLATFEGYDDYVFDVKWHPTHPAIFASVDGSGHFDIWNLNVDTEVPLASTAVSDTTRSTNENTTNSGTTETNSASSPGLNKLAWDRGNSATAAASSRQDYDLSKSKKASARQQESASATNGSSMPGSKVAIGASDGKLYIYNVADSIVGSNEEDWDTFRKTCATISSRGLGGTWAL